MTDPAELSLVEAVALLGSRELSARELVASCVERVTIAEPEVGAFATFTPELAWSAARAADESRARGEPVGPLAGVPVAVKDLFLTGGAPTRAGSRVRLPTREGVDSAVWRRLVAAGAGLMGKTTMHEFAMGTASPPTRNPWDLERTSGGSSGGSAAALAARMVPAAVGSDTGGSLRIPAAVCGVAALRPGSGRIPTDGMLPFSHSLDIAGPLARRVLDLSLLMTVLAQPSTGGPAGAGPPHPTLLPEDLRGVRVGVAEELSWSGVEDGILSVCQAALEAMAGRGADIVTIVAPPCSSENLEGPTDVFEAIAGFEALQAHRDLLAQRDLYTPQVLRRVLEGAAISSDLYEEALRLRAGWTRQWRTLFQELRLDVVAHPTLAAAAPHVVPGAEPVGPRIRLSLPWSLTGFPALNVPVGLDGRRLPVGLTLAGVPADEGRLLRIAGALDEDVALWRRTPSADAPIGTA